MSCAECRYDSSRHALARRGGVCGRAPSLPYTQSDPPGRDAAEPVYHLRGRCPEVFLGRADQRLWWTGRTEDRQRAVARIAACRRVSRRHSYHQRTERTGGFGQVLFVQYGVCVAIQRQQERASAVGFRVRLGCYGLYADPSSRPHYADGRVRTGIVWTAESQTLFRLEELALRRWRISAQRRRL